MEGLKLEKRMLAFCSLLVLYFLILSSTFGYIFIKQTKTSEANWPHFNMSQLFPCSALILTVK